MSKISNSNSNKAKAIVTVLTVLSASIVSPLFFTNNVAYAMGDNPSSCPNLQASKIIFMVVHANGKNYYPSFNKNVQFLEKAGQPYSVTFTYTQS